MRPPGPQATPLQAGADLPTSDRLQASLARGLVVGGHSSRQVARKWPPLAHIQPTNIAFAVNCRNECVE
ncbi:hypothetical protein GW17_00032193 [Ensete ventricosum]|nr:hypothetical protein GW17_00032193 [Ensete ventricosum]RZS25199.1 hypothetical protein BHM03_00058364 [Ensete ventricosum]